MSALGGVVIIAAVLAVVAGIAKLHRPLGAVRAMRAARLPTNGAIVRGGAAVELLAGAAVLVHGGVACLVLAGIYAGFAWFNIELDRLATTVDCGCFGEGIAMRRWRSVSFDAVCALTLVAGAATGTPSALTVLRGSAGVGIASVAVAMVGALLAVTFLSGGLDTSEASHADG